MLMVAINADSVVFAGVKYNQYRIITCLLLIRIISAEISPTKVFNQPFISLCYGLHYEKHICQIIVRIDKEVVFLVFMRQVALLNG